MATTNMTDINAKFEEVQRILPNMSETERRIAKQRLHEGYTVQETVDNIVYDDMGGYSLEEYMSDMLALGL